MVATHPPHTHTLRQRRPERRTAQCVSDFVWTHSPSHLVIGWHDRLHFSVHVISPIQAASSQLRRVQLPRAPLTINVDMNSNGSYTQRTDKFRCSCNMPFLCDLLSEQEHCVVEGKIFF